MANKWIQKATQKMKAKGTTGAFSQQAKNAGMTTKQFANKVLSNKDDYSSNTVKRAQFAKNVAGLKVGGSIDNKLLPKAQNGKSKSLLDRGCNKPSRRQVRTVQRQRAQRRSGNITSPFNARRRRR